MRLRTVVGGSVAEALEQVQKELGPNALVLETLTRDGRAEVVAADVERESAEDGLMRLRAELALLRRELKAETLRAGPAGPAGPAAETLVKPRLALVHERLAAVGLAPELQNRVLTICAAAPPEEGDPLDPARSTFVRNAVAGLVPGVGPAGSRKPRCFAFVGPPGAGKTTTIAKLAEQTARTAGRSLGLLTLDGERPGGGELLRATAERLGIPYRSLRGPEEIHAVLREGELPACILVDTAGLGPRDQNAVRALKENLRLPGQVAVHLVVPANLEPAALVASALAFKPLEPAAITFTKLDESERLGALVNLPAALSLPVAALCHGRSLKGDLTAASRPLVADVVLGRRDRTLEVVRR